MYQMILFLCFFSFSLIAEDAVPASQNEFFFACLRDGSVSYHIKKNGDVLEINRLKVGTDFSSAILFLSTGLMICANNFLDNNISKNKMISLPLNSVLCMTSLYSLGKIFASFVRFGYPFDKGMSSKTVTLDRKMVILDRKGFERNYSTKIYLRNNKSYYISLDKDKAFYVINSDDLPLTTDIKENAEVMFNNNKYNLRATVVDNNKRKDFDNLENSFNSFFKTYYGNVV